MASFRTIVNKYRKGDGTYRVYIRVVHNRKHRDIATPFNVTQEQITRSFKLKDANIIDSVEKKISEYRRIAAQLGFVSDQMDIDEFVKSIEEQPEKIDFFDCIQKHIKEYEANGQNKTASFHRTLLIRLKEFNDFKPLYLYELTSQFVNRFYEFIAGRFRKNTIHSYMSIFETDYKYAQKLYNNNDTGRILVRYGIFDSIKTPQVVLSKDNALPSVEMMQRFIDCEYGNGWWREFSKDMFILCFLTFGTNIADFRDAKKSQVRNEIFSYRRHKTAYISGSGADIQIKLLPVARFIIDKYKSDDEFLICFNHCSRNNTHVSNNIHYYFDKIGLETSEERQQNMKVYGHSKYTFYSNRHTMASFARNICGVDYMTVHQMLNHAAPSEFRTTDTYLARDFRPLWEANEKLYNLFDWSFYLKQTK